MSRTYRALTTLALSLALVATTAAVAVAAPSAEDQNDRLLRGIETAQADHAQAAVERAPGRRARVRRHRHPVRPRAGPGRRAQLRRRQARGPGRGPE